jgi:hypothetical protein
VSFLKLLEKALSDQFVQETDVSVIGTIWRISLQSD